MAKPPHQELPEATPPKSRHALTLSRTETCMVTGKATGLDRLIRFVINPQKEIVPDLYEKLPGKAFYITAELPILKKAIWRNTFTTVAREPVTIPENLIAQIEQGLARQAVETLNMARRAGQLLLGFAKIEEQLRQKSAGIYIVANDVSDHSRQKLEKLARELMVIDNWNSEELSQALGEANTNHVLLSAGSLAEKLTRIIRKLNSIRTEK